MGTIVAIEHVLRDDEGTAWIKDANVKVIELVMDQQAYGWSPEEIHFQHPNLSLAQIHAALAFYYDHQSELDAEIQRRWEAVEKHRNQNPEPPLVSRLRSQEQRRD